MFSGPDSCRLCGLHLAARRSLKPGLVDPLAQGLTCSWALMGGAAAVCNIQEGVGTWGCQDSM